MRAGTQPVLPVPALQYADFAAAQHEQAADPGLARQLDHWRAHLAGLEPVDLPTDRPRPAYRDPAGATVPVRLPAPLAHAVVELGRRHGGTPFMVLLAVFDLLLARHTGRWDVVVGTPVAGRIRPELAGVLGCFLNSLVLRSPLDPAMTFAETLAVVRRTCLDAFANQEVPFERLVQELGVARDSSRTPLYQVLFELVEEGLTSTSIRADDQDAVLGAWATARTDLTLYLHREAGGTISGGFEYATALFDRATIERLAEQFVALVEALVADPHSRVSEVDFLSAAELAVVAAPAAGRFDIGAAALGEAFATRARATPGAVAVVSDGRERPTRRSTRGPTGSPTCCAASAPVPARWWASTCRAGRNWCRPWSGC